MDEVSTSSESDNSVYESDVDMSDNKSSLSENAGDESGIDESVEPQKLRENPAWADAMAKILKTTKPKRRKTIVLSRAKRANEIKTVVKEEHLDFEIETSGEHPDIKVEKQPDEIKTEVKLENGVSEESSKKDNLRRIKKKDWASRGYAKPCALEKDREKALAKIATRGVVQLFNAVREHQKSLDKDLEAAGPMEHKKDKVFKSLDKKAFLDVLMGPAKSQPVSNLIPKEIKEDPENPTWSTLREDFMMSSKLKDWDKKEVIEVDD